MKKYNYGGLEFQSDNLEDMQILRDMIERDINAIWKIDIRKTLKAQTDLEYAIIYMAYRGLNNAIDMTMQQFEVNN